MAMRAGSGTGGQRVPVDAPVHERPRASHRHILRVQHRLARLRAVQPGNVTAVSGPVPHRTQFLPSRARDKKTPAMRLGLAEQPLSYDDVLVAGTSAASTTRRATGSRSVKICYPAGTGRMSR